jgi:hypothetical protein
MMPHRFALLSENQGFDASRFCHASSVILQMARSAFQPLVAPLERSNPETGLVFSRLAL